MSHILVVEEEDAINLCSDSCHRTYARRINVTYEGWNGTHEVEFTDWCENCGVVLPGFEGDSNNELCGDQDANFVVARFRSEEGEKCERHDGRHWIQVPSSYLLDEKEIV